MSSVRLALALLVAAMLACSSSPSGSGTMPDASSDTSIPKSDVVDHDTWANFAQGFFKTYCVECHNATKPAGGAQNFNEYADVKALASTIRCGVAPMGEFQSSCSKTAFPPPGQFPIGTGPYPSDADRLRIIAWINAGLPE
jgi:hypothetical protein